MSSTTCGRVALAIAITCCSTIPAQIDSKVGQADQPPQFPADKEIVKHAAGFQYSILKKGNGTTKPSLGDTAVIHYSEWLSDGTLIRTTRKTGVIQVSVGDPRVPFGLAFGPQLLTKGGRVKLTVPPDRAYGKNGVPGKIPPHSTMIYEVELVDYQYRPKPAQFVKGDPSLTKASESGLKYQVLEPGEGASPSASDIVEIEYTIWDITGKLVFGSYKTGKTDRAPITMMSHPFLQEVLPMMKRGSVWRVVVPADMTMKELVGDTVWNLKLIHNEPTPSLPKANHRRTTSTKSGLQFERLLEGKGDRPRDRSVCELEWSFWKEDGTFVAGSLVSGNMPLLIGRAQHKFLDEIVRLMQVGGVMRVEVPQKMTTPQMLVFDSVWRLKLVGMKEPLPIPKFQLPKADQLTTTKSGLQYKVLERGDGKGPLPRAGMPVTVHYAGWLRNGKVFDSSYEKAIPLTFDVGGARRAIDGLDEGFKLMKAGDTFLFVIPGKLGYGARGTPDGTIPPDATLVFQVQLLSVGG